MKKLAIAVAFTLLSTATLTAQNSAVNRAQRAVEQEEISREDLVEAKEYIDAAVEHDKTKDKGKTWYVKGQVYLAIAASEHQDLADSPGDQAAEAFRKVKELEKENSYYAVLADQQLNQLWSQLVNAGAQFYDNGEYEEAVEQFNKVKNAFPEDTTGYLYAGMSAMQSGDYEAVEENYKALIDMGYENYDVYSGLIWIAKAQKNDNEEALALVEQAREKMPENLELMREEINLLLNLERTDEALEKAEEAIKAEPENAALHYILGYLYDELDNVEKAQNYYEQALEVKPDYFDAAYNLAVLYFNRGVEVLKEANNMDIETYQKRGKEVKAKAHEHFKEALPYLEKAHEINPEDKAVIEILETTYTELGMEDKAQEYNQKLEALGGSDQ